MFRKDLKPGEDVEELKIVWETLGSAQVRMVRIKKIMCLRLYALTLKGSRQRERRGFGKVSNIRSMSRTGAIEVLFSFNFAVVFDFKYFRFRPSKAKWIGDVLTIRQNAANTCSVSFFWSNLNTKDGTSFPALICWRNDDPCAIRQCATIL